jgi:hypothetical protein
MRRPAGIAIVLLTLILVTAAPAAAKEFTGATLNGPGGPRSGLDIDGPDAMTLADQSDLLEGRTSEDPPPKASLGPRYVLAYAFEAERTYELRQVVYPFAKGGAWVFVPPGQEFIEGDLRSGWTSAGPPLTNTLAALGLPAQAAAATEPPPAQDSQPAPATPASSPVPYIVAGTLLLGAAAVLLRLRTRSTSPTS